MTLWSTPPFLLSQRTQRCGICIFPLRWTSDWLVPLWSGLVHAGICQGQEQIIGALESFPLPKSPVENNTSSPTGRTKIDLRITNRIPPNYTNGASES